MLMNEKVLWIWLSLAVNVGGNSFAKLYERYHDVNVIYELEEDDYVRVLTSKCVDVAALCDKSLKRAEEILDFCESRGVGILLYCDEDFPKLLREIPNPPVLLYYRGTLPDFNDGCYVSIVGTRSLTDYGRRHAFTLAHDLAYAGARIVSGMAIGIDGVAHCGAISGGGITVAVLGSGINVCYPKCHNTLAKEIVKNGCVLTEYPPNAQPKRENFPRRNRIISGLCCATIVIEGSESSGAIITARCARLQGRKLYALPGNVGNKTSEVGNILIRNGAKLIMMAEDVIDDFEFVYGGKLNRFILPDMPKVDMFDALCQMKVSCVAPSDGIFNGTKNSPGFRHETKDKKEKRKPKKEQPRESNTLTGEKFSSTPVGAEAKSQEPPTATFAFDGDMLKVYQKIPTDGECSIESLCSDELKIKDVLRILFRLDAIHCIEMLPSERVRRK